jgi:hypothetical protein
MRTASKRQTSGIKTRSRIAVIDQSMRRGKRCRKRPGHKATTGRRSTTEEGSGNEIEAGSDGEVSYGVQVD